MPNQAGTHADQEPEAKLTAREAALIAGVKPATWRAWRSHGRPRPEPVPQPDGWFELRVPWWHESTVRGWVERRTQHLEPSPCP